MNKTTLSVSLAYPTNHFDPDQHVTLRVIDHASGVVITVLELSSEMFTRMLGTQQVTTSEALLIEEQYFSRVGQYKVWAYVDHVFSGYGPAVATPEMHEFAQIWLGTHATAAQRDGKTPDYTDYSWDRGRQGWRLMVRGYVSRERYDERKTEQEGHS